MDMEMNENDAITDGQVQIDFCTLGMFIIDEIHYRPPIPPKRDVLGGAGTYSALGARLLSPPPLSKTVGWLVDRGSDFPSKLQDTIERWETHCVFRDTPDRLTTRGWNGYGENEHRAFRYMTPKLRLDHDALTPELLMSRSFHLICSSARCIDLVTNILRRRQELAGVGDRPVPKDPLWIWEPVPDLCTPEELNNCLQALKYVDVVSPNHSELGGFFGVQTTLPDGSVDKQAVESCSDRWLQAGIGSRGQGAVVVRAGKSGCFVASNDVRTWIPAYHHSADKVVDPTGGGNTFLGGLAVGLMRYETGSRLDGLIEGAIGASVAASFAIEQVGMPILSFSSAGETWNDASVSERLAEFKERLKPYVQSK